MTVADQKPAHESFWTRLLRAIRDFDEALHYDPNVELDQRISRLEMQIAGLSKDDSGRRIGGGNAD